LQEQPVTTTPGRVGKPSRPLFFGDTGTYGAVFIQPHVIDVAIVSSRCSVRRRQRFAVPSGHSAYFDRQVLADIRTVLQPHTDELQAIGCAVPAVFNADGALVASTTIPDLVGSQLPDLLARSLETSVILEDDARSLALGQRWFGQARGERAFA